MHFYNEIKKLASKYNICLFVDMDGVIAAYAIGNNPFDFRNKRPLKSNISNIKEVVDIPNVELHILSVCRENSQVDDKNAWLDENASFFKKENREIISRESQNGAYSKDIKLNFLKNYKTDKLIVLVDDDNEVLKYVRDNLPGIIVMQDSELVD